MLFSAKYQNQSQNTHIKQLQLSEYEKNDPNPILWSHEPRARYCHIPEEDKIIGRQKSNTTITDLSDLAHSSCSPNGLIGFRLSGHGLTRDTACTNALNEASLPHNGLFSKCIEGCNCK